MQVLHTVHCTLFYRILNIISLEDEQTLKHFCIRISNRRSHAIMPSIAIKPAILLQWNFFIIWKVKQSLANYPSKAPLNQFTIQ